MKYYFITYQAKDIRGTVSVWNEVIDISPMEFILKVESVEEAGSQYYRQFAVTNTCEISQEDFNKHKGQF